MRKNWQCIKNFKDFKGSGFNILIRINLILFYRYIRHGSYPLASPYNETYPESFNVEDSHKLKLTTNNVTLPYSIKNPKAGRWFLAGFLPKAEHKYTQAVSIRSWYQRMQTFKFIWFLFFFLWGGGGGKNQELHWVSSEKKGKTRSCT